MTAIAEPTVKVKRTPLIHAKANKTPVNKDSIEGMTRETDKTVRGTFMNVEYPGQTARVCGKYYKGMEYFAQTFQDGEVYSIPLSVARFINERCYSEQHTYLQDEKGNPLKTGKKITRYKFIIES